MATPTTQKISVIVPQNPFVRRELREVKHCLAALDVTKLMDWWPGKPHVPDRDAQRVRDIQRALDWKRVAQIAAYLLQEEIIDTAEELDACFNDIYEPKKLEPGREWPPRVPKVIRFERSEFPTFSNVLLHVNGAQVTHEKSEGDLGNVGTLMFDENDKGFRLSVIDGQHRINGAYFAVFLRKRRDKNARWEIPSEVFIDLDAIGGAPRHQAQIFIDVNFNQKKVDRSLVADLFPTARGRRAPLDQAERAQDLGRRLMLETGPLVGMIQIPGIKYGVSDVVTLATLNSAIKDILDEMTDADIAGIEEQSEFLALCLDAWLEASGRKEQIEAGGSLDPENVAYQGRVLVSFLTLIPACILYLKQKRSPFISSKAKKILTEAIRRLLRRAGLLLKGRFVPKSSFRQLGYLGSGGIARFRDTLWAAAFSEKDIKRLTDERKHVLAEENRTYVRSKLAPSR